MSPKAKSFYGKDVASAIKEACDSFNVAQEHLTIEVIETGSTGIFGLIRKKAHIKAVVQEEAAQKEQPETPKKKPKPSKTKQAKKPVEKEEVQPEKKGRQNTLNVSAEALEDDEETEDEQDANTQPVILSTETLELIRSELDQILVLMGYPSNVTVEATGGTVHCNVSGDHEDELTGQEGRTIDSLQYLLRKIVSRKISERVRLTIDIGNYRERRHQELRDRAIDYAALVKQNGKTQVIPSLNPSERRVVHVALQDDSDIRSRSVGEGLFKKVLIYKPGKGRKSTGRKRSRNNHRKKSDGGANKDDQS